MTTPGEQLRQQVGLAQVRRLRETQAPKEVLKREVETAPTARSNAEMRRRVESDDPRISSNAKKQVRRRLQRRTINPEEARVILGGKPLEDWDIEELAKGYPRDAHSDLFPDRPPLWVTLDMREKAWTLFTEHIRSELGVGASKAVDVLTQVMEFGEEDAVRLSAAKYLLDHVVGKAAQKIEADVELSVKGLLASVMVNPGEALDLEVELEEEEYQQLEQELEDA